MSESNNRSPAGKVMDKAIKLAIAEKSPYPEQAAFIDADTPFTEREMKRVASEGYSVVLVSPDGSTQIVEAKDIVAQ